MPKEFSNEWYYSKIVEDFKKNPNNRTFTISHVPKEQRHAVEKLLLENYGGNTSDKRLAEIVKVGANTIPLVAGGVAVLPEVLGVAANVVKSPTFWKDVVLPTLGGEVVNKSVRKVSNNKYSGFGDFAYNRSGIRNFVDKTVLEIPSKIILEGLNPGLQTNLLSKIIYRSADAAIPAIKAGIQSQPALRRIKYKIDDYMDGIEDLQNHVTYKQGAGSKYIEDWKKTATKHPSTTGNVYKKDKYTLVETPEKTVFSADDGSLRVGNFTNNSYYVTITPPLGQTKAPISSVKTLYNIVDSATPGTYFVADPTSLPKGLIWKDLYDNNDITGLVKSLLGLDDPFTMGLSGYSADAHKYINQFRKNPNVTTRYNPVPMTQLNSLGQSADGKLLYNRVLVADVAENPGTKKKLLGLINDQLNKMNAEPAYISDGLVQIPQPSLMAKYPVVTTVSPETLLMRP